MSATTLAAAKPARGLAVGRVLIVVGGALVAVSSWLNWGAKLRVAGFRAPARTAYTIPAKFVLDNNVKVPGPGLSLGIVVLVLGLLVVVAAFVPGWRLAGLLVGLAAGVVAVLYVYQVRKIIHDAAPSSPLAGRSFRDLISIGTYLAGIGAALAVIGAVVALIPSGFWSSLTSEEEEGEEGRGGSGSQ